MAGIIYPDDPQPGESSPDQIRYPDDPAPEPSSNPLVNLGTGIVKGAAYTAHILSSSAWRGRSRTECG